MKCPSCSNQELSQFVNIGSFSIDQCAICGGLWFDSDELRKIKDEKVQYAKWFDFDLWDDKNKFKIEKNSRACPKDNRSLLSVQYGDSGITIDACISCQGIWLDKNEFAAIIEYIKKASDFELLHNYVKNLVKEGIEICTGPENFKSEIEDFLIITRMLQYKLVAEYPGLAGILSMRIPPLTGL